MDRSQEMREVDRFPRSNARKQDVLTFAALSIVVGLLLWRSSGRTPDDAFIFFRYARNLVKSHVWSYNPGLDTLNGATSPLWTATLSLAYWLTGATRPVFECVA